SLQQSAEHVATKAGEHLLVDRVSFRKKGGNIRDRVAKSLGILRGEEHWDFQNASQADQQLRISYELIFLKNRGQQLFLNIYNNKCALIGFQRTSRHFGVIRR